MQQDARRLAREARESIGQSVEMAMSPSFDAIDSRLAIVVPDGPLDTIPFVCDLSEHLATRGYLVDIFGNERAGSMRPEFTSDRIRMHPIPGFFDQLRSASGTQSGRRARIGAKITGIRGLPGLPRARRASGDARS